MRLHLRSIGAIALSAGVLLLLVALKTPAAELDPASAVRGSLGVSLEDLSLTNHFGRAAFLLNGGFALLFGALAGFAFVSRRRRRGPLRIKPSGRSSPWSYAPRDLRAPWRRP
jgi:hypothetical protein